MFERREVTGGRLGVVEADQYRFDTGPTILLMPHILAETFEALGARMVDHLDLVRVEPGYRVVFDDGEQLTMSSDLSLMHDQLERLERGSFRGYLAFLEEGQRHYEVAMKHFVRRQFSTRLAGLSPASLLAMARLKALRTHYSNARRYFSDPRLLAAFTFQNMYLGVSPFAAPATFSLLQFSEKAHGMWYPLGGMYEIARSLGRLAGDLGVDFRCGCEVKRIEVNGHRATGVTLQSGETVRADAVVANADLPYVYRELLPDRRAARRLARMQYSSSALMFFLGVSSLHAPGLVHHNMHLSERGYRQSFASIFDERSVPDEPSFYVCAPAITDRRLARSEGQPLTVLVPVGHLGPEHDRDWTEVAARVREAVIARLKADAVVIDECQVRFEERWTPQTFLEKLNLVNGSTYGLSHTMGQVGPFRPFNRHATYANLFFVGASTHPGTGLPIVLISAELTASRMLSEVPALAERRARQSAAQSGSGL